jgi:outer membrane protein, multidrug efflux system
MNRNVVLLLIGTAFVPAGCTLAPKYTRPEAPVPTEWPTGPAYKTTATPTASPAASEVPWRQFVMDERLQKVIEMALANNRDLRLAALNVERARAMYGIQRADLLPAVTATGSAYRQHVPADMSASRKSGIQSQYSADFGILAWEIDFFGRLQSLEAVALEQYLATEQARRGVQISLISGVATAYLTLATDQENFQLAQSTLESRQAAYNLIRRRYEVGIARELDLRQAEMTMDAARVDTILYTRLVAQDQSALNLLAGESVPPGLLPAKLSSVSPFKEISPGTPSEVLLGRPDILAAESQLKAANANIGAARASFFPRISLTSTLGTASNELSGLFKNGSDTWTFAPQGSMPIFDARTWAALDVTKADQAISVAAYERSIQAAFREVADTLALRGTVDEQMAAQQSLVDAASETYRLANARYTRGVDNYLAVIDAQRSLYGAQQGLVALRMARLASQVRLYAVLGGGGDAPSASTGDTARAM